MSERLLLICANVLYRRLASCICIDDSETIFSLEWVRGLLASRVVLVQGQTGTSAGESVSPVHRFALWRTALSVFAFLCSEFPPPTHCCLRG